MILSVWILFKTSPLDSPNGTKHYICISISLYVFKEGLLEKQPSLNKYSLLSFFVRSLFRLKIQFVNDVNDELRLVVVLESTLYYVQYNI